MGKHVERMTVRPVALCTITALVAFVLADVLSAFADTAQNAFVSVTASGVRRENGRDFSATGDVAHVVANPGWRLRTASEVRLDVGAPAVYRVGDLLGENDADGYIDVIRTETEDVHVAPPAISAKTSCGGPFIIAYSASNKTVSVSFSASIDKAGLHRVTTRTYKNGELGKTEGPENVAMTSDVWKWEWTAGPYSGSSDKQSFTTNLVFTPGIYEISGTVKAKCDSCGECAAIASAETNLLVSLLKVECNPWIGQDRTGDPLSPYESPKVVAAASLAPPIPGIQGVEWEYGGDKTCDEFHPGAWAATLWSTSRDAHSKTFLGDSLKATVLGTAATTNFTVVAVDVTIDCIGEKREEAQGAFVSYAQDDKNGALNDECISCVLSTTISCEPGNLPPGELASLTTPAGFFFARSGDSIEPAGETYRARDVNSRYFMIHGHKPSTSLRDCCITVKHGSSGAIDLSKFTVVECSFVAFADQPGSGGDADVFEYVSLYDDEGKFSGVDMDVGHAFWEFQANPVPLIDKELRCYLNQPVGYYPSGGANLFTKERPGYVALPDVAHVVDVEYAWHIPLSSLLAGLEFTRQLHKFESLYNLVNHNCVDAVVDAGRAAGVLVPDPQGRLPGYGDISNPGMFGEALRTLKDGGAKQ